MLTKKKVLSAIKNGKESDCIDGRDYFRLATFIELDEFPILDVFLKEGYAHEPISWTKENFLKQLEKDLEFAFEKALDQQTLSAFSMHSVIKMWLWILEDDLQYHNQYAQYGLPLFKAVAEKYGLPNPIGDFNGDEEKFAK